MDENAFWELLEDCRPAGPDPDADLLAEALSVSLSAGPLHRVVAFAEKLSWLLYRLDRREYGRGLSGDQFLYTRCAVVAAGRAVYESVLDDPAEFVPYAEGLVWAEGLLYVPDQAYEHLTGEQWPRATRYSYESFTNREGWAGAWLGGSGL
ncbi:DUF4240 domain-containing protein [Streptomyces sp. NPDC051211]|uniref:DUF4240 domain-containing protein n=1 Tax=Streptomyces sp. NPDC051211 TaxID=3154643 RepID=UPI00344F2BFE